MAPNIHPKNQNRPKTREGRVNKKKKLGTTDMMNTENNANVRLHGVRRQVSWMGSIRGYMSRIRNYLFASNTSIPPIRCRSGLGPPRTISGKKRARSKSPSLGDSEPVNIVPPTPVVVPVQESNNSLEDVSKVNKPVRVSIVEKAEKELKKKRQGTKYVIQKKAGQTKRKVKTKKRNQKLQQSVDSDSN